MIERLVAAEGDANQRFIDFDSGNQFTAAEFFGPKAEPSPEETRRWWEDHGIDAVGDTSPAVRGLVGFDMVAVAVPLQEWMMGASRLADYLTGAKPGTPVTMPANGAFPATFAIQTREGGRGLLQITGFNQAPPKVLIRYKLVEK